MTDDNIWVIRMDAMIDGPHHINDMLEKDFDRQQLVPTGRQNERRKEECGLNENRENRRKP